MKSTKNQIRDKLKRIIIGYNRIISYHKWYGYANHRS